MIERVFSVGDRVIFVFPGHHRHGNFATVEECRPGIDEYRVVFDLANTTDTIAWTYARFLRWADSEFMLIYGKQ
jgi:hypothetical protein